VGGAGARLAIMAVVVAVGRYSVVVIASACLLPVAVAAVAVVTACAGIYVMGTVAIAIMAEPEEHMEAVLLDV